MATTVQIEVSLDDQGVVTGVNRIGSSLNAMGGGLQRAGQIGNVVYTQMARQQREANEAARLGVELTGVQFPRALTTALSRMPAFAKGLSLAFNAALVLAFADAVVQAISKLVSYGDYAEKVAAQVQQMDNAQIGASKSLALVQQNARALQATTGPLMNWAQAYAKAFKEASGPSAPFQALRVADQYLQEQTTHTLQLNAAMQRELELQTALKIQVAETHAAFQMIGASDYQKAVIKYNQQLATISAQFEQDRLALGKKPQEQIEAEKKARADMEGAIFDLKRQYADKAMDLIAQEANATLQGFAKIDADARAKIAQLNREFERQFGTNPVQGKHESSADYQKRVDDFVNASANLARMTTAVQADQSNAALELQRKNTEETVQLQEHAAIAALPEWERATAQIAADYHDAMRQVDEQLRQHVITEADANARRVALWQEANARMVDDLASKLQQLGDAIGSGSLGSYLTNQMKQLGYRMLAAWLIGSNGGGGGGSMGAPGGVGGVGYPGVIMNFAGGGPAASGGFALGGGLLGAALGLGGIGSGGGGGIGPGGTATTFPNGSGDSGSVVLSGAPGVGFGGIFRGGGGIGGIGGLAALGGALLGKRVGGSAAMAGALIGGLGTAALYGAFGMQGTLAAAPFAQFLGPAAGGLIGFGVGSQHGALAGGLSGAGSGALVGLLAAGPIGALIGGIVGALGGIFGGLFGGSKRKKQAQEFAAQQLQQVSQIENQYKGFQLDFASALGQLESIRSNGNDQLRKLKGEGKSVFEHSLAPAIGHAEDDIKMIEAERQRRATLVFAPPQFAAGGFVSAGMGSGRGIMAVVHPGEFVVNPQATSRNRGTLESINRGGSPGAYGGGIVAVHATDGRTFAKILLREGLWSEIRRQSRNDAMEGR